MATKRLPRKDRTFLIFLRFKDNRGGYYENDGEFAPNLNLFLTDQAMSFESMADAKRQAVTINKKWGDIISDIEIVDITVYDFSDSDS